MVFTPITDSTVRLSALRSGELDMIERVSPSELEEIRKDKRVKVGSVPELGYQVIRYNIANGPKGKLLGEDPRVREAIEAAHVLDAGYVKFWPGQDGYDFPGQVDYMQIWDYTKEGGKWALGADKGSGGLWNNDPKSPGRDLRLS